ncbi:alpha/beta fold hydrolase [Jatrophihabitans sp.]|uniref:alpha/beta fold hydrolase n=1 Tax=Jatrophihabitans sp. TaxID=1932789 RepID=UPI0030C7838A|nr:transporter related protein [Jatrophihabitans sp.]
MTLAPVRSLLRTAPRRIAAAIVAVAVVVAAVLITVNATSSSIRVTNQFIAGTPEGSKAVRLDTSLYLPAKTPAPAILLAHGFGGSKASVAGQARSLAEHGYVVLTYSARGFGHSGGLIHFDSPQYEVHDASLLVTYLAGLPQTAVRDGKPELGVAGASYGGGLALLLAESDPRIEAVAADITWSSLVDSLFPNGAGTSPGVFKKLWTGLLFSEGFGGSADGRLSGTPSCGRYAADVCSAYQASARTGVPSAGLLKIMQAASPSAHLARITAPTLLSQGEQDSLFPLSQADANAKGIAAAGTPVRVVWRTGGHDTGDGTGTATTAARTWFGDVFGGRVTGSQSFQLAEQGTVVSASTGDVAEQTLQVPAYPGLPGGVAARSAPLVVLGKPQRIGAPAGGTPAAISSIPGLGGLLGRLSSSTATVSTVPGQSAAFVSAKVSSSLLIAGTPTVRITITAQHSGSATLFAGLRDASADGSLTLPQSLVSPLLVTGLKAGVPRTVTVRLPAIVHTVPSGHRVVLTVATTDFAYQLPQAAATYTVAVAGAVSVPTVSGKILRAGHPLAWLLVGLLACLLAGVGVALVLRRRRRVLRFDPALADVPVRIDGLVKEYAGGYRAVDGVSLSVERGQVLGLLGPNGAGKTTTLRVLVGLILPTKGSIHVFGEPIVPGAPVLARLGAFIEGPGFLPHLSGRENLRLYWAATARPLEEAHFDTALDIAGLGSSVDRRVRTYSQGMRQRLGIAQAMLGLPELLVLDEPTNGLDPPQIAEMREVLQRYAATGRTVVVSSHLLAEVEQTCTHVAVMHKGRLVAAGSVAEIAGAGGMQLAVAEPERAASVLAAAGITAQLVPARRALEDVFLDLIGGDQ